MDRSLPRWRTAARAIVAFLVTLVLASILALALVAIFALALSSNSPAAAGSLEHGGDIYASGDDADAPGPGARNLYLADGGVALTQPVERDAHIAGFDVDVEADIGGDLYVAGALVSLDAAVGGDVTVAAFRLRTGRTSAITGNTRAAARTVVLDGNLTGAALITAERLELNGVVDGDLRFAGRTIDFGPNARVGGILTAQTPYEPDVPASVASPDRVRHELFAPSDFAERFGKGAGEAIGLTVPTWWMIAGAITAFLLGLILVGVLFLGLAPRTVERLRADAERHVWRSLGYGLIGLSTLLGLVPLAIITIVGLPLIPVILLLVAFLAVFAYLLGAYVFAHRVFRSFGAGHATMAARLRTFVIGLLILLLLNVVPIIGWLINALAALVGFGALEMRLIRRLGGRSTPAGPAGSAATPPNV